MSASPAWWCTRCCTISERSCYAGHEAEAPMSRKVLILLGTAGIATRPCMPASGLPRRAGNRSWPPLRGGACIPCRSTRSRVGNLHRTPRFQLDADVAITAVAAKEFAAVMILGGRPRIPAQQRQRPLAGSRVRGAEQVHLRHRTRHSILTAAELLKGRTVTCHPHVRVEVDLCGAIYSAKPAVRDGKAGYGPRLEGASGVLSRDFRGAGIAARGR